MHTKSINSLAEINFQATKAKKQNRPVPPNYTKTSLERTPSSDFLEKKGMSTGAKALFGVLGATTIAVLADVVACKGKHIKKIFGKSNVVQNIEKTGLENPNVVFKSGKAFNEKGELFTGVLSKTRKNGDELVTGYYEGEVIQRVFRPKNNSEIIEIVKNYDTRTYDGLKTIKSATTKSDGSTSHSFVAKFTEHKFSPEVEAKIKMKDFEKFDVATMQNGVSDLGNGISIRVESLGSEKLCSIWQNGNKIAEKNADHFFISISSAKAFIEIIIS